MTAEAVNLETPRPTTAAGVTRTGVARLDGIDMLRGLMICLMVLDHVRDFFMLAPFGPGGPGDPLDLDTTNPALFATRWITNFCAPVFVLLAGLGAYLQTANGKSPKDLSQFLLTRGLWLIFLELTVIGFGWQFTPVLVFLQVIWAIGWSMVLLSLLTWLPVRAILALGVVIVASHNLLDPIQPAMFGEVGPLWNALHVTNVAPVAGVPVLFAYPILPWFGIMLLGYGIGQMFTLETDRRRRMLTVLGLSMIAVFVLLRSLQVYGDSKPWEPHPELWKTIGDFIDVQKYPPSLQFVLITIGPALAFLPVLERLRGPVATFLLAFGRAPLFAYVLHIWLAHLLAMAVGVVMGLPASGFFNPLFTGPPEGWGFNMVQTYGFWALILAILYLPTQWFAGVKARRRDWWLGYL
ncbi:DUF1624 domain-containing protein [Brevundimonas sp.]|uniref:DUF1624 domain-containing protein n=1 Tax=Brevundimonas sp. TaxID=1871086 RepID=UPI003D1043E2